MRDDNEKSILTFDEYGNKRWRDEDGLLHRIDGPAVEYTDGSKRWYRHGARHRLDGPAMEDADKKVWFENGKLHRIGGPAVEDIDGGKEWYQYGMRHRIDGPAIEYEEGNKDWFILGVGFLNKEDFFNAITDEEKEIAPFSKDFHNA